MSSKNFITVAFFLGFVFFSACVTGSHSVESDSPDAENSVTQMGNPGEWLSDADVDLTYILGHRVHRYTVCARSGEVQVESFLDRKSIKKGTIDQTGYQEWFQKVRRFALQAQSHQNLRQIDQDLASALTPPCRSPFKLSIRVGQSTQVVSGCRTPDTSSSTLGQIAREVEFLLYSQNESGLIMKKNVP